MLDPHLSSRSLKRRFYRAALLPASALVFMRFLFPVPALVAAQQSGAVPLAQGIADLASQLAKSVPNGRPMTIAVTDFVQSKQVCGLGQFVAERLSTLLSRQPQCRLIERHRLDQVLQELKFSMSELVDPAKARKLGQMLGAQGLVVGTITDLGAAFDVDARIIDIQTDVSLPGATTSIIKDEAAKELGGDCAGSTPGAGGPHETVGPDRVESLQARLSKAAEERRILDGEATEGTMAWPGRFTFSYFDKRSGRLAGQVEWITLGAVIKIEGILSGTTLTFKGTEYIRSGPAVLGVVYVVSPTRDGNLHGTWSYGSRSGNVWLALPPL